MKSAARVVVVGGGVARGRYLGMDLELISASEAKKVFPLMEEKHFLGAIYDPIEGDVDPYGVTHAYAKAAQIGGAEIVRHRKDSLARACCPTTWSESLPAWMWHSNISPSWASRV